MAPTSEGQLKFEKIEVPFKDASSIENDSSPSWDPKAEKLARMK